MIFPNKFHFINILLNKKYPIINDVIINSFFIWLKFITYSWFKLKFISFNQSTHESCVCVAIEILVAWIPRHFNAKVTKKVLWQNAIWCNSTLTQTYTKCVWISDGRIPKISLKVKWVWDHVWLSLKSIFESKF